MRQLARAGRWLRATARHDAGMVSAEMALALPALVAVAAALLWLLALASAQVGLGQAAREGARAAARGDSSALVRAAVQAQAPGALVVVERRGVNVVVSASMSRRAPIRLLGGATRMLHASATSRREEP